jgi:Zn-dependent protease
MNAAEPDKETNMKWSASIGRVAGIELRVHATFPLLFIWVAFIYWQQTGSAQGVLFGLALVATLFLCVVMHEYGHALTARRFGIPTRHITLLPIGGVAALESMPKDPKREILVAVMGPAVNVAIAAALFLWLSATADPEEVRTLAELEGENVTLMDIGFLPAVMSANIFLVVFNMIPAFPMDGGRVLRAALSFRNDRLKATRIAAGVGQAVAVGFGLLGLMGGNPFLVLIAVFVWFGAQAEAGAAEVELRLERKPASRAMITDFQALAPDDPLSRAVDLTLGGSQKDFPVLEQGRPVGVLTWDALLRGLHDEGRDASASRFMTDPSTAQINAPLSELLKNLQQGDARLICILHRGQVAGLVDLDNIQEYLRIRSALEDR